MFWGELNFMAQASQIFKRKYNLKNLNSSYEGIINKTTASGIDKITKYTFDKIKDEQLKLINKKVVNGNYKFTYYKEKLILKNRNSFPRMISVPTIRDRIVMKLLHELLMETFEIKMRLVQTIISEIIVESAIYDSYIKIDIQNFFGSIKHEVLMKKIKTKIRKKEIIELVNGAIINSTVNQYHRKKDVVEKNKTGVPQGVPIANVLAEIYMKELDGNSNANSNFSYFRYVDDIIIFCKSSDLEKIKKEITSYIEKNLSLPVNQDKTYDGKIESGFSFLGYEIQKDGLNLKCRVKEESVLKMENSIVSLFIKYKKSNGKMSPKEFAFYLNLKITGSIIEDTERGKNKKYGWLFFYSQINDIKILYHLDYLVKCFIEKFDLNAALKNIEVKRFVKSYYEITQRRSKSNYIFRPNKLNIKQKKVLLNRTLGVPLQKLNSDENVEKYFNLKVNRKIKELEEDIQFSY